MKIFPKRTKRADIKGNNEDIQLFAKSIFWMLQNLPVAAEKWKNTTKESFSLGNLYRAADYKIYYFGGHRGWRLSYFLPILKQMLNTNFIGLFYLKNYIKLFYREVTTLSNRVFSSFIYRNEKFTNGLENVSQLCCH